MGEQLGIDGSGRPEQHSVTRSKSGEKEKKKQKKTEKKAIQIMSVLSLVVCFGPLCKQNVWVADTTFETFLFHFRLIRLD